MRQERTVSIGKDLLWILIWSITIFVLALWDFFFLNKPALVKVITGFFSTILISFFVVIFSLILGWVIALGLHFSSQKRHFGYIILTFILNLIRSIPQIVGILFCYIGISFFVNSGLISNEPVIFVLMSISISIFIIPEIVDLIRERIDFFKRLDFYNAMRVCGISESRIINFNILWKNSRIHIFNKLISIFGIAVFLQCSVDFIISVGLSSDVNSVSLPATLGSLLANIDSKQDILAVGYTLTHPGYFPQLFLQHLQGVNIAFLIVFTLLSIYNISNGYAERHRL